MPHVEMKPDPTIPDLIDVTPAGNLAPAADPAAGAAAPRQRRANQVAFSYSVATDEGGRRLHVRVLLAFVDPTALADLRVVSNGRQVAGFEVVADGRFPYFAFGPRLAGRFLRAHLSLDHSPLVAICVADGHGSARVTIEGIQRDHDPRDLLLLDAGYDCLMRGFFAAPTPRAGASVARMTVADLRAALADCRGRLGRDLTKVELATALGVSEATLQRRLLQVGSSWSALREGA